MKLDVNPTRMELLRLKKRTALAKRGHKLLKDKQDELVRQLLILMRGIKELREEVEKELTETTQRFLFARALMEPEEVQEAFLIPTKSVSVIEKLLVLMNLKVPEFEQDISGEMISYSFITTSSELDASLIALESVIEKLIDLASKEKALQMIADEIVKTRRRVNSLEYVLIPALEETVKFITMKLSEMERSDQVRIMKIKDIVRAH